MMVEQEYREWKHILLRIDHAVADLHGKQELLDRIKANGQEALALHADIADRLIGLKACRNTIMQLLANENTEGN